MTPTQTAATLRAGEPGGSGVDHREGAGRDPASLWSARHHTHTAALERERGAVKAGGGRGQRGQTKCERWPPVFATTLLVVVVVGLLALDSSLPYPGLGAGGGQAEQA